MSPDGWVPIANATAQNRALSWRAKGLLLELMSYPDGFNITFERLMKMAKASGSVDVEGRDAMRRAMQELERKGYLSHLRVPAGGPSKQRWRTETAVCDLPGLNDDPGGTGFQYPQDSVLPDFSTTKDQEVINNTVGNKTSCNKTRSKQEETASSSWPPPSESRAEATRGGGGGVSFDQDQDRDATPGTPVRQGPTGVGPSAQQGVAVASPSGAQQQAEPLVAALDYRGRPPGNRQRAKLLTLVAAALAAGWSEQDLKTYLDLGGAAVNSAAAVYVHRLDPGELPNPETFREATRRPLVGTDATVAGWMALARQLHKPFDGGGWDRIGEAARNDGRPAGWEKIPWCGDPDCDEITRTHEERDWQGLPSLTPCARCHPEMRF